MKHLNLAVLIRHSALGAAILLTPSVAIFAQGTPNAFPQSNSAAAPAANWTTEQLITSTVHQAWLLSGRSEENFFAMVKALAEVSAKNRGITLPDTAEAGARAGNWIKMKAKQDPDQLLYVVVDQAVQYSARPHPSHAAKTGAAKVAPPAQ